MSMWGTLPRVFDRVCSSFPDRTAIVAGKDRVSYREMWTWANRVANGLAGLGVGKADKVGMLMPNVLEFIPTQHGIWKSGAALVQMPARATADDLRFFLSEADASTLIYHSQFDEAVAKIRTQLPRLTRIIRLGDGGAADVLDYHATFDHQPVTAPAVDINQDDLAYVAFTSGTTGVPKGLLQSHRSWSHYSVTAGLEIADTRPGEVFAHIAPLTHFTQTFVMPTFIRGGTNVLLANPDIDLLMDVIAQERVTAVAVVPTILYLLLDHPRRAQVDLSSLQTMVYCGSPVAAERLRQGLDAFGPIFVQSYAGSEPGYMTCLRKEEHRMDGPEWVERLSSAGRAMLHVDISVQDDADRILPPGEVGEICARQEGQMIGYVDASRNPEAMRDGWVHSGDIGYVDESGYVYILDRKKDMIITGGFNVFPRQIEDVLLQHPAVANCAVIGVPHEKWGEAVTAIVVLKPGASASADDLVGLVKEQKGSVWAPKTVEFVDHLPLNPSGKVDKKSLRAPYWAGRKRQIA